MEQQTISSDLIRGHIDTIILHSLIDGDKFAQQISDSIEEKSSGEYKMNQATLYSSLKRLENLKYVSSYWFDAGDANGRRKFFKVTDLGKVTVKGNLNNWSYSRALIDKLVDCAPEPIYQTKFIEKVVEVPVEKIVEVQVPVEVKVEKIVEVPLAIENSPVLRSETESSTQLSINSEKNNTNKVDEQKKLEQAKQEINFRNILSGLIRATQPVKKEKVSEELEPVVKLEQSSEKLNFNETISTVDYNSQKAQNNGKIDFGDIVLKAAKEGYKVRISSKDSSISKGKLLINKLNLFTALTSYLILLVEFLMLSLLTKSIIEFSSLSIALILSISAIFPVINILVYLKTPKKRTNKIIYADMILTSAIIVFNLLLITFAGNLILGVDLTNKHSLLIYLILPAILYIDVVVHYILRFYMAKNKIFIAKNS